MSTQRFSILAVSGLAATAINAQLQAWSRCRLPLEKNVSWCSEAWTPKLKKLIDEFSLQLKEHGSAPPISYFAEWIDTWSGGKHLFLFSDEPNGTITNGVAGQQFDVFWRFLPDCAKLLSRLSDNPQYPEDAWLQQRIREAHKTIANANNTPGILVLMREGIGASVLDEEVDQSRTSLPEWVAEICRDDGS